MYPLDNTLNLRTIDQEFFDRMSKDTDFHIRKSQDNTVIMYRQPPDLTRPFNINLPIRRYISFIIRKERCEFFIENLNNFTTEPIVKDNGISFKFKRRDFLSPFTKDNLTMAGEECVHYHRTYFLPEDNIGDGILLNVCENMTLVLFGHISDQMDSLPFKKGEYVSPINNLSETFLLIDISILIENDSPVLMCKCVKHQNHTYSFLHTNDILLFRPEELTRSIKQKVMEYFQNKSVPQTV